MSEMKVPPLCRVKLTKEATTALNGIKEELLRRGLKEFNSAIAVERAFQKLGPGFLNEVIDEFTPFEYRLQVALADDKRRKQIEKIIEGSIKKNQKSDLSDEDQEV
jgi:hypothetical protein